jgi:PAS domain S-box-containing protein
VRTVARTDEMVDMISVLFVDDDPAILHITKLFLERPGDIKVDARRSVLEGLELLRDHNFDVIVSDYEMPQMDGLVFLKIIRVQGDKIPFIIFTGKGREWVAMEAVNNGADFYLTKGEDPKEQFSELRRMIIQAVQREQVESCIPTLDQKLIDIIHYLPDATFAIDHEGTVVSWNRAMETLTGIRAEEILHKGQYEYSLAFHGERRPILIDLVMKNDDGQLKKYYVNVKKEGDSLTAETTLAHLKGKEAFLWAKATRVYDDKGYIIGAIESVRDITEIKRSAYHQKEVVEKERSTGLLSRLVGKKPETWYDKGVDLYHRQGRFQEALQCFEHAIAQEEGHSGAWKGKGICLKELGRYEEARQSFDQAITLSPRDAEGYYYRGEVLEKMGKANGDPEFFEKAIQAFERVIEMNPDNVNAWNYAGICYRDLGKQQEAKRCFDRAQYLLKQDTGSKKKK